MPMPAGNPTTSRTITVTVPATSANLGPGFDCLGLALDLRNEISFSATSEEIALGGRTEYTVEAQGIDAAKVPTDRRNLAIEAAEAVFRQVGRRPAAVRVRINNCIPVGSGLGSSSSAIVGGLVAANTLVDGGLSDRQLLRMAVEMEGHPDNVAPAMLGGLVLGVLPDPEYGPEQLIVRRFEPPRLTAVVVLPDFQLLTSEARAVLPPVVARGEAIFNISRFGLLLHALTTGEYDCLRVAMSDRLHQPHRLKLIPGALAAYEAAYAAGAGGVALSGAGPSLIAFAAVEQDAIARTMVDSFADAGLTSRAWVLEPSSEGIRVSSRFE